MGISQYAFSNEGVYDMRRRTFLSLLGLLGCKDELENMNIAKQIWWTSSQAAPVEDVVIPDLAFLNDDTVFYIDSSVSKSCFQETTIINADDEIGVPLTIADTDEDNVGMIYDLSNNALVVSKATDASYLKLGSDAGKNTYFKGTGYLDILGSSTLFKHFHASGAVYSICFWLNNLSEQAATQAVLYSITNSASYGITVTILNTESIQIACYYGTSGQNRYVHTTTVQLKSVDGWQPVIIRINGNGVGAGSIKFKGTTETFTVNAVGATNNATFDLRIGTTNSGSLAFYGGIDNLLVMNRIISDDEITAFEAYNPSRSTTPFRIVNQDFDFNDITTLYTDIAGTTQVASDDDPVAYVKGLPLENFGTSVNKYLVVADLARRALYKTNITNGKAALLFDGSDDLYGFNKLNERGGAFIYFIVAKNTNANYGSTIMYGVNLVYTVITGENYNGAFNDPYCVIHHNVGAPDTSIALQLNGVVTDQWTVYAIRREGDQTSIFNYTDVGTITNISQLRMTQFGGTKNANFNLTGYVARLIKYNGYMTDDEVWNKISSLRNEYGI